ncbi:Scavenger receptor class B member 1 [Eumeta japonica]|uniref:Scavenger receptor class B member 1 n=1 Tax=Eumeta variegata TaxID=151549 RepID=A0A4C1X9Y6_EUMVA|nr:Scavenger receptor class B member 1 [Eumeta japonica]
MVQPQEGARASFLLRADSRARSSLHALRTTLIVNNPAIRSSVAGCLLLLLSLALYLINPVVVISKHATRISEGSEIYKLLNGDIETIHISSYLFNVTNAARFLSGEDRKLKVKEIGPFKYREIRINKDINLDSDNEMLHYTPSTNITLIRELSAADPADVMVTMPNVALLSMSSMMSHKPFWMKIPFNLLTSNEKSQAIINMSAHSYLWGYEEPLIKLGNKFLPGWIFFTQLGLLDRFLDRERPYKLVVSAANHNRFQVMKMNDIAGLTSWGYGEKSSDCNTFSDAYEGLGYPAEMTPSTRVRLFRKMLCRMLDLEYVDTVMTPLGVKALKYQISRDAFDLSEKNACLCPKGDCVKGYYDVSPCFYDLPLAMSQAHFLDGDPSLLERIEGLSPDPKLHGSEVLIEPTCGVALTNTFTMQINVKVDDVTYNNVAKPFANMMVPIAWFKIHEIPPTLRFRAAMTIRGC